MSEKKRWNSLDFAKGLACIAVVFIHFNFPNELGVGVRAACRFAVPVFFFVSGFFLGWQPHVDIDANKLVRKIRHIVLLMVYSGVFYAAFTVFQRWIMHAEGTLKEYAFELMTAAKVCKFFIQNDPFLWSHLWFLLALLYCYLLVLIVPFKRRGGVCALAVCLMGISLIMVPYHPWVPIHRYLKIPGTESVISLFNLFIFRGFGPFALGMFMSSCKDKIADLKMPNPMLVLTVCLGIGLSVCEGLTLERAQLYLGSYVTFIALVLWAIKNPGYRGGFIGYIGRELSLYIYILHVAVGKLLELFLSGVGLEYRVIVDYIKAFMVLGLTIVISAFVNIIWKRIKEVFGKKGYLCLQ